jgi:hypothetical protein
MALSSRPVRLAALSGTVLFVFLAGIGEARDPDLGFHLATGRAIRAGGRMLDHNPLTFIQPSPEWVVSQGVSAALFDRIVETGGIGALILFKATLIALTFALLLRLAVRLGASLFGACAAVALACLASSFRFVERPLVFSNLVFAAVMLGLVEARLARKRRWAWLAGVAATAAMGCHLHAGAVFSFFLLGIVAVCIALEPLRARWNEHHSDGRVAEPSLVVRPGAGWIVAVVAVASAALAVATLAIYHPYPLRVLETPFVMGSDPFLAEHLVEFRPPWRLPFEVLRGFWILAALGAAAIAFSARRLHLALSLVPVAFLLLALRHGRFADLFSIAMAPTLALAISAVLVERTRALRAMICSILGALILFGAADHVNRTRFRLDYGPEVFGKGPLDFVEEEHLSGPAFLSDGWAGPFLARFYPHQRVFFFPAFDAFLPQHYREYMDIRYGKPGWAERLDALGVELCVLKYTSPNERRYQGGEPNLRQHLARDARWALLYFDDLGEIFVRRAGANATAHPSLIADHAIHGLDPDRLEWFSVGDETRSPLEWLRERQANRGAPSRRLGWAIGTMNRQGTVP